MTELVVSLLDSPLTRPLLASDWWGADDQVRMRTAPTVDSNSRAMQQLSFDVAEMSFATFLHATEIDGASLFALPAFTGRRFTQSLMGSSPDGPALSVESLRGARVAVPQYWMTSSVWHREVLGTYYGVAASDITWVTCEDERFDLQPNAVAVERAPRGATPVDLVESGDCLVALMPRTPDSLRPLFEDSSAEESRYHSDTGVFPIMHLVVVRASVVDEEPGFVARLWAALLDARDAAQAVPSAEGDAGGHSFGNAPWTYGLDGNLASLTAIVDRARAEGLITRPVPPHDLFVPTDSLDQERKVFS